MLLSRKNFLNLDAAGSLHLNNSLAKTSKSDGHVALAQGSPYSGLRGGLRISIRITMNKSKK